ncbi:energy transducer TonB [Sphingobium subterraneum]|uniref:Protein TonB n=1 Tax=Sphingobium subterraneum TaxID=627688 RepID=A0A841J321_9SPHN|nr:TonB family protein [Sphingobium subterraneum]MBB6124742.1 protein TonB [Sphingobium subterraneum]
MVRTISGKCLVAAAALVAFTTPVFAQSADWQRQVARLIASKQTYPRAAQMRGDEGTVKVKVYVSASGAIEKTEMVTPSGSSVLDREALALPAKAGTFPAPPGGATTVVLPLTWKLM